MAGTSTAASWTASTESRYFCSAEDLQCQLTGNGAFRVCLRDGEGRPGTMAALKRRECPGLPGHVKGMCNQPAAKAVSRALDQA